MGTIYLSQYEVAALKAVDVREVERLVEAALRYERPAVLYDLHLSGCGLYVSNCLHKFERDLAECAKAKAAKKRSDTRSRAWSSGHDLLYAVRDMIRRMEEEEKELQLLRIDEAIIPPHHFRERIDARIHYQWRKVIDDAWNFGTITFVHDVDMRPDHTLPLAKRKPSAAKQQQDRQDRLYRHWEHLARLGRDAVRKFLKDGGDGGAIPETFQARPDRHDRYLNNFSCDFWREPLSEVSAKPSKGAKDA